MILEKHEDDKMKQEDDKMILTEFLDEFHDAEDGPNEELLYLQENGVENDKAKNIDHIKGGISRMIRSSAISRMIRSRAW